MTLSFSRHYVLFLSNSVTAKRTHHGHKNVNCPQHMTRHEAFRNVFVNQPHHSSATAMGREGRKRWVQPPALSRLPVITLGNCTCARLRIWPCEHPARGTASPTGCQSIVTYLMGVLIHGWEYCWSRSLAARFSSKVLPKSYHTEPISSLTICWVFFKRKKVLKREITFHVDYTTL